MQLKKVVRSMGATLAAAAMTIGLMGMNVSEAEAAGVTVDNGIKGSLTIHKYVGDAINGLDEYASQKELDMAVKNAGESLQPLEGVTFKYVKVGDMGQYTKGESVYTGYTMDEKTKEFLEIADKDANATVDGTKYYNIDTLESALRDKSQTDIETQYIAYRENDMTTDADGIAKAEELPTGLYLVYEYSYPSNVNVTTAPFFVSIPMTDNGEEWIYDVNVYPKNQTENISVRKSIVSEHGETKKVDAEIGREVMFKVEADVPENIGKMNTFTVKDILGEGLDFVREDKVYGIGSDGAREELTAPANYGLGREGKKITYTFNPKSLADSVKKAKYKTVEITYAVKMNGQAVTGTGNVNKAALTYSQKTNVEEDGADGTYTTDPVKARVYTYAVDVLKYGNGDVSNTLKNVTFRLLDSDKNEIKVTKGDNGYYLDPEGNAELTSDADGKIYVKGIKTGTYYLRETKTNKGYNLLKDDIEIKITPEKEAYTDETSDDIKVKCNYTMNNGVAALKINNTKGFLLPATGGKGATAVFALGGMLVLAGVLMLKGSGKEKEYDV